MPFRFDKLTHKSQEALQHSQELAAEAGNPQLEPLHLLAALLAESDGVVRPVLEKMGADVGQLTQIVEAELKHLPKLSGGAPPQASRDMQSVLNRSQDEAEAMRDDFRLDRALVACAREDRLESEGCSQTQRHRRN